MNNELLTIDEAAQQLGCKPKTLRMHISARRLEVVRPLGWSIRISQSEIKRILEEGTIPAAKPRPSTIEEAMSEHGQAGR